MPSIVVLLRMFQEPMYVERTEGISIKVLDKPRIKGTIRCQCGEVGEETSVGPYHRDTRRHACRHGNRPGEYCYHIAHPHCSNRQHNATHNATAWSGNAKRGYVRNQHSTEGRNTRGPDVVHSTTTLDPPGQLFDRFPLVTRLIALREDYVAR